MKAFDLDAAKRGAAVCTRNGRKVRILCYDKKGESPIVAAVDFEDHKNYYAYDENGTSPYLRRQWLTLMMRDDDYLEKLERGEYAPSVRENRTVKNPVVKQNLTTDREYWRRAYAGRAMQGIFAGRNWHSGEMIPDCIGFARNAVELADALIEELEKTEK